VVCGSTQPPALVSLEAPCNSSRVDARGAEVVVVVMVPNVTFEGSTAAGLATKIIAHYLHKQVTNTIANTG